VDTVAPVRPVAPTVHARSGKPLGVYDWKLKRTSPLRGLALGVVTFTFAVSVTVPPAVVDVGMAARDVVVGASAAQAVARL